MFQKHTILLSFAILAIASATHADPIGGDNPAVFSVNLTGAPWTLPTVTDGAAKVTVGPHTITGAGVTITNNETTQTQIDLSVSNGGCLKRNSDDDCNTDKAMKVTAVTLADLGGTYTIGTGGVAASKTVTTVMNEDNDSNAVSFTFAQGTAPLAAGQYSAVITITATSVN